MSTGIDELSTPGSSCLPGQPILALQGGATVIVGRGLRLQPGGGGGGAPSAAAGGDGAEIVVATVCGTLRRCTQPFEGQAAVKYDVVSPTARAYVPRRGDAVIGTVVRTIAGSYLVNVGGAHPAVLDALAFDGATKSIRPKMEPGDVVYCRVTAADRDVDPEITCCATAEMTAKDWVTGEAVYGPLKGGAVVSIPLQYASDILHNNTTILLKLGERVPFEACVGANGRVWLNAPRGRQDVLVALVQCVLDSRGDSTVAEVEERVVKFFPTSGVPDGGHTAAGGGPAAETAVAGDGTLGQAVVEAL